MVHTRQLSGKVFHFIFLVHCGSKGWQLTVWRTSISEYLSCFSLVGEVLEGDIYKDDDENTPPWWIFLIIPIISGIVGFVTNVVAIKMCFYPLEFWGWKLWQPEGSPFGVFGWQGIVPTKAKKTVGKLLDLFLTRLIDVNEIFGQVDPQEVALHTSETRKVNFVSCESSLLYLEITFLKTFCYFSSGLICGTGLAESSL